MNPASDLPFKQWRLFSHMNTKTQIRKMTPEEMREVCARPSKMSYEDQVRSIQEGIRHRGEALPVPVRFRHLVNGRGI